MTLREIYKKALKNNYKGTFQDFIKDFSNCRGSIFTTITELGVIPCFRD